MVRTPRTPPIRSKWHSLPTEAINPTSLAIDKLPAAGIVDLMLAEDRKALSAVQRERDRIAVGADLISKALRKGGRVVFVGAGTSGRLGVLESAEMPPTFGTDPLLVQAIMAGGKDAIFRAKEGAEDNYEEGARAITRMSTTKKAASIGVPASGSTPFGRGALPRGRQAVPRVVFLTCHPGPELQPFSHLTTPPAAAVVGVPTSAGKSRPVCRAEPPVNGSRRNPKPDPTGPLRGWLLGIINASRRFSNRRDSISVNTSALR